MTVLQAKGWLSEAPDGFQRAVLDRCQLRKFRADSPICRIGDPPTGVFGMRSGIASVEFSTADGTTVLAAIARPGSWLGLMFAMAQQPLVVNVVARTDAELAFLSVSAMHEIAEDDPRAWQHFARMEAADSKRLVALCEDLMRRSPFERIVAILLHFGDCRAFTPPDADRVEINLSQDELARTANVGRTMLSAVLHELESVGDIAMAYRRIDILAPDRLRSRLQIDGISVSKKCPSWAR